MRAESDGDLIADYLDGRLGAGEAASFRDRVVAEPALARALYLAAVDEAFLRAQARGEPRVPSVAKRSPRRRRASRLVGVAALAAALVVAAWVIWPSTTGVVTVARVERLKACQWDEGGPPAGPIARGQAFQLRSGVAEFTTQTGVRTVFEGPAAFQFEEAHRVRLTSGRLFCDVPKGAEGFTVQTANGRVVDLGTRFGVEIAAGETEVHVVQGRVRAEIKDSVARLELSAGQAGRFQAAAAGVTMVPFQRDRFAGGGGLVYEPFDYKIGRPLVGQGEWFDRDTAQALPAVNVSNIRPYPPLPAPRGAGLHLNPRNSGGTRPVGRPWPASFTSALLWLDDDFIKGMKMNKVESVGLIGFGPPDLEKFAVQLVARPGKEPRDSHSYFGLRTRDQTAWCSTPFKYQLSHLVVLDTSGPTARLWVDPPPMTFEAEAAPASDAETAIPARAQIEVLWIGQPGTPKFAEWQVDEIRGGFRWADVTPRAVAP